MSRGARAPLRAASAALVLAALLLAGCSPLYVLRVGYEEAKILWRREPITRVLARDDLDPATRRKLLLVLDTRRFAEEIGLDVGGRYATLSHGDHVIWVLTAAARAALEPYRWWFPIVGHLPYKGFFDRAHAEREAEALEAKGYDTYVRPAAAFSTLGWFDDPLLGHLLAGEDDFLVNLLLHELYHATFFLGGADAMAFNESVATFVGHRGAIAYFQSRDDAARVREAERAWEDELRLAGFIAGLAERLRETYAAAPDRASALAARTEVFAAARAELAAMPFNQPPQALLTGPLNNAVLLHYRLYTSELGLFDTIYRRTGDLRAARRFIEDAAERDRDRPLEAVGRAFAETLETPAMRAAGSAGFRRR